LLESVLRILQDAGEPLTAAEVKKALQAEGLPKAEADKAWPTLQKRIKSHEQVVADGARYQWAAPPEVVVAPAEALERLLNGDINGTEKAALAEVVRDALSSQDTSEESAKRQRQAEIDAVRLLAELASEVEELIVNETEPPVLIRQVRAWVKRSGLDPVGRAGEETKFDRTRHQPIIGRINDGAPVIVVRPGYIWKTRDEDVLLGKAVVEE
jgi:predicted transcriptional regulator